MGLYISEAFVNLDKNAMFGESEPWDTGEEDRGKLFRYLQREYGRCISKMYCDTSEGTKQRGWVFQKRMEYEDSGEFGRPREFYIREVWVTVYDAPPTKTIEYHYHNFGSAT